MRYEKKCFVVMPFSKTTEFHSDLYWTNHFDRVLRPLIKKHVDIPVERSKPMRTDILRDIIKNLIFSSMVVADITDLNPNVLWELGVRQSFTNGTVVIAEHGTPRPFDLSIKPILEYPKLESDPSYYSDMAEFESDFSQAVLDCLENPDKNDSHVLETISGRGTIFEIIYREENIRKLDAFISELDFNKQILTRCQSVVGQNRMLNPTQKRASTTERLMLCAAELLLTNRYLKEDDSFYLVIKNYHTFINATNSQLDLWPVNWMGVEEWLTNKFPEILGRIARLNDVLIEKREKLQNQV